METVRYLRALGRSWYVVIFALAAGGLGGFFVYEHATPQYRASVRMIVSGSANGNSDEVTSRVLALQRAEALSQVASTPPAVHAAAAAAGYPGATPGVSSSAPGNGPFLTISVVDTNATRAQKIANSYARTLVPTLLQLEGQTDNSISVANLAPAARPASPFSPVVSRDVGLGLAAGLIVGLGVAFLREASDRTVRDTDELEQLTGLTVLGTVPRDSLKSSLPANSNPRSPRAEAYRQIRTTLLNSEAQLHTVAITSAMVGEGKTSVATNLAAVFSRAGHRVALVDADLRRPRVATVFGLPDGPGLADVLSRRAPMAGALTILHDGRLAILSAGTIPANPSEALGSDVMREILDQLASEYEYVFIDTPPVLPVTDALVIAPMVDGVVLVTRLGRTTRDRVKRAQAAVGRVNAVLIGVVPNHASGATDRDYGYRYKYTASHKRSEPTAEIDADMLHPPTHHATAQDAAPAPAVLSPVGDSGSATSSPVETGSAPVPETKAAQHTALLATSDGAGSVGTSSESADELPAVADPPTVENGAGILSAHQDGKPGWSGRAANEAVTEKLPAIRDDF